MGKLIQHSRNLYRYSGAHNHVVHAGEHRAVQRRQVRGLDLLEVVDADQTAVPFAGQPHLGVVRADRQFDKRRIGMQRPGGNAAIGDPLADAVRDIVCLLYTSPSPRDS